MDNLEEAGSVTPQSGVNHSPVGDEVTPPAPERGHDWSFLDPHPGEDEEDLDYGFRPEIVNHCSPDTVGSVSVDQNEEAEQRRDQARDRSRSPPPASPEQPLVEPGLKDSILAALRSNNLDTPTRLAMQMKLGKVDFLNLLAA